VTIPELRAFNILTNLIMFIFNTLIKSPLTPRNLFVSNIFKENSFELASVLKSVINVDVLFGHFHRQMYVIIF